MIELETLKAVNFDWVMRLESVWKNIAFDVPEINSGIRAELLDEIAALTVSQASENLLGNIIVGGAGAGKTHLLASLRKEAARRGYGFVLVDLTDVHDFWDTTLLGYLSSFQQPFKGGDTQVKMTLEKIIKNLAPARNSKEFIKKFAPADSQTHKKIVDIVVKGLMKKYPMQTRQHHDVVRALFMLHAEDIRISNLGYSWLQGLSIDSSDRNQFGLLANRKEPKEIVKGLSWLMSLQGPVILALDQLDSIVQQHHILSEAKPGGDLADEQLASLSIIEGIGNGLSALVRSVARRTAVIVTCFEATWEILRKKAIKSDTDSYNPPRWLQPINQAEYALKMIEARLQIAFDQKDYAPAYPSWPFRPSVFDNIRGLVPREVLMLCEQHRKNCLRKKKVTEVADFSAVQGRVTDTLPETDHLKALDRQFAAFRKKAPLNQLIDERHEDELLAPLLQTACRCLILEKPPKGDIDAVVDIDFGGGKRYSPLHSRIRLIDRGQNDLEKHYCLRAIQKSHAVAFQARLKAAVTAAGIDRKLRFRHLVIIRSTEVPSGKKTAELVEKFFKSGGLFAAPDPEELAALWALHRLEDLKHADFEQWLQSRLPVSGMAFMQKARLVKDSQALPQGKPPAEKPTGKAARKTETVSSGKTPPKAPTRSATGKLPLARVPEKAPDTHMIEIEPALLAKHVIVLAGAGSGKTVLVRRLVEESALLGIPAVVIDSANDLARLGDRWPEPPEAWSAIDRKKESRYHKQTEVVIWTPGREKGNPLTLEALPDLAAVSDDKDELHQAISMTVEAMREHVAPGQSALAKKKIGVLHAALESFAATSGKTLADFLNFLSRLPRSATAGIGDAAKLAAQIADSIRAAVQTNPLMRQSGEVLEPGILFGENRNDEKTRISVINFIGLPSLTNQQEFLNQLAMTLFAWIKKNPATQGRPIRGLLVIDEAKDFIPSVKSAPCKLSLQRLAAQARKYGLGLIFATQSPKDIDNTVVTNCTTHYYGRANSPNAIKVISEQLRLRGMNSSDIPKLKTGEFYLYTENMESPLKILSPLCLSHHPPNPLNENEVLERAQKHAQ